MARKNSHHWRCYRIPDRRFADNLLWTI